MSQQVNRKEAFNYSGYEAASKTSEGFKAWLTSFEFLHFDSCAAPGTLKDVCMDERTTRALNDARKVLVKGARDGRLETLLLQRADCVFVKADSKQKRVE